MPITLLTGFDTRLAPLTDQDLHNQHWYGFKVDRNDAFVGSNTKVYIRATKFTNDILTLSSGSTTVKSLEIVQDGVFLDPVPQSIDRIY